MTCWCPNLPLDTRPRPAPTPNRRQSPTEPPTLLKNRKSSPSTPQRAALRNRCVWGPLLARERQMLYNMTTCRPAWVPGGPRLRSRHDAPEDGRPARNSRSKWLKPLSLVEQAFAPASLQCTAWKRRAVRFSCTAPDVDRTPSLRMPTKHADEFRGSPAGGIIVPPV